MATIHFNGQDYDSPEAMPPEVRQLYDLAAGLLADKNQDGVPDIFAGGTGRVTSRVIQSSHFIIDGKAYSSLDEVPAEARRRYEQMMGQFDTNLSSIPDLLERGVPSSAVAPQPAPDQLPSLVQVVGEPSPMNRTTVLLAGIVVVLLLIGAALYLLSR